MTPTREQVIEWAKNADEEFEGFERVDNYSLSDSLLGERAVTRFAALAYSAGRAQGLREAREVCEQRDEEGEGPDCWDWHAKDYAAAIKQLEGK